MLPFLLKILLRASERAKSHSFFCVAPSSLSSVRKTRSVLGVEPHWGLYQEVYFYAYKRCGLPSCPEREEDLVVSRVLFPFGCEGRPGGVSRVV
ncbi:hypothetical protein Taro_023222 [Colocasia esculenta]|uniref:Uncharacterized protein n=1 Tax=Colocasia esculenta TaxID=4460 RepID=A0A843VGR7_COLES|nr:hypothetical protein [Colocasia esculenta]